jgi:hypothetical protein
MIGTKQSKSYKPMKEQLQEVEASIEQMLWNRLEVKKEQFLSNLLRLTEQLKVGTAHEEHKAQLEIEGKIPENESHPVGSRMIICGQEIEEMGKRWQVAGRALEKHKRD